MSATNFELSAQVREDLGKGASRRLRRTEKVLGIVYGGEQAATPIILEQRHVVKALENEAIYSHILSLSVNGKKEKVVLRDIQRHPYKAVVLHMDFLRVNESDVLTMTVPLHFLGGEKCPGVENGGIVNHQISDVEIRCQAANLPEFIEVDISKLDLDQSIHLSELKVPAGVELVMLAHGHDIPVVSIHLPRQTKLDEEQALEEAAAEAAAAEIAAAEAAGVEADNAEEKADSAKDNEGKDKK
jgi:large subunit ribosomal protein L25